MNSLEKKSFYSFLGLYIISSTIFILLSAYWYYTAQKNALQSNHYYKLRHISDRISQSIINAHMQKKAFALPFIEEDVKISLIDVNGQVSYGSAIEGLFPDKEGYFERGAYSVLVSDAPQRHLNIRFVVVRSKGLLEMLTALKHNVLSVIVVGISVMIALAWLLSKLFMRPLHQKIDQIEDFVHDTAHELNTPITALSMSVSRALQKKEYDEKLLRNISISTKQLFDIYTALSYLSFESPAHEEKRCDISQVLKKSVAYYEELAQSKKITISLDVEPFMFKIDELKLSMLFGNLINNAIKYSLSHSHIDIVLKQGVFCIKDQGIGIEKGKLSQIFEKYNRQSEYAGGFGIGLSIVKKITQEYALDLGVVSEKGKGSSFTLDFNHAKKV